ncbi:MAG: putative metal-binding motif-containing protein, partial [Candidatus Methylomirabilis sp.]|nr:putative metal-binding motif-containing protein [Deltaproteobacteria bacterium]
VGEGACERAGSLVCDGSGGVVCDATPGTPGGEACNGVDDDCDGAVDEDYVTLGASCRVGQGACEASGVIICGASGLDLTCNAAPRSPGQETCNGLDDDCDGRIDEPFDLDGDGYTTCGGDCDDASEAANPGAPEVCNGVDDNCAGGVDEGFDLDEDGFTTCQGDCDDALESVFPGALEAPHTGLDEDCDRMTPDSLPDVQDVLDAVVMDQVKEEGDDVGTSVLMLRNFAGR